MKPIHPIHFSALNRHGRVTYGTTLLPLPELLEQLARLGMSDIDTYTRTERKAG